MPAGCLWNAVRFVATLVLQNIVSRIVGNILTRLLKKLGL
jgi:hypothetical protein